MITGASVYLVSLETTRAFEHARAGHRRAENIFFRLRAGSAEGWGEAVPRPYVTGESPDSAFEAIASLDLDELTDAVSFGARTLNALWSIDLPRMLGRGRRMPAAACAVELALLDVLSVQLDRPLPTLLASLPIAAPERRDAAGPFPISRVIDLGMEVTEFIGAAAQTHHIKLKVGSDAGRDLARVRALREHYGPAVPMSVDANMEWSLSEAISRADAYRPYHVAWYEEPLAKGAYGDYRILRDRARVPVMLDESVTGLDDLGQALELGACDAVNVRISKCGGLLPALKVIHAARARGLGFQIGVQVGEMGPLWAAGRHLVTLVERPLAYEAGQADRLFPFPVMSPPPYVDRRTYLGRPLPGLGFGMRPSPRFDDVVVRRADWTKANGRWSRATHGDTRGSCAAR